MGKVRQDGVSIWRHVQQLRKRGRRLYLELYRTEGDGIAIIEGAINWAGFTDPWPP